jgi:hypothetical protein
MIDLSAIRGSDKVLAEYGRWPSFHDFEVVKVEFERKVDKDR